MSEGYNCVQLLGNLGADPELKVTPAGGSVLKLRLATTKSYLNKEKQKQERTEWHRISIWGKRAEGLAPHLHKGDRIFVQGELRTDEYEKDGVKKYSTEIVANEIVFAGGSKKGAVDGPQTDAPQVQGQDDEIPF